jgi:glycosyltransferase involved in cell wall biosynthesis
MWHALFGGEVDPSVAAAAARALELSDRLVFEAEATRALYAPHAGKDHCLLVPYGIETAALDAAASRLNRAAARQRLRLHPTAKVLLCMGTFEPRKAQTLLVRAFAEVADRHPTAELVLVGDNGSQYAEGVRRITAGMALGRRIRLEPVAADVLPWYLAADILVSASDVESMPRSALEAMAVGTPVLAAAAYGVPELVEDGVTGWLVRERDLDDLIAGLDRALAMPAEEVGRIAGQARVRVRRDHDAAGYVAVYEGLLDSLIAQRTGELELSRRP